MQILIDTGATHNVIDCSTAGTINIVECRITTTVLVGSGMELSCRGACFTILLRINNKMF